MINLLLYTRRRAATWGTIITMLIIIFCSCAKKGIQDPIPEYTRIGFEIGSAKLDPVLFNIKIGISIFADSVPPGGGRLFKTIEYTTTPQRLTITEINSKAVLLDTTIVFPRSSNGLYTVFQVDTTENAKPLFIFNDPNKPNDLPADKYMLAFYCNSPFYPEVFDILVYRVSEYNEYVEVPAIDTIKNLRRGEFSEFLLLDKIRSHIYEIRKPNGELMDGTTPVDPANTYSGLVEGRCDANLNNHQVSKLSAIDFGGGFILYYTECMFMY